MTNFVFHNSKHIQILLKKEWAERFKQRNNPTHSKMAPTASASHQHHELFNKTQFKQDVTNSNGPVGGHWVGSPLCSAASHNIPHKFI